MNGFSDVVLERPKDTPVSHDTFKAKYINQYLEDYVDSHVYNGKSIRDRIRLNSEVSSVEKLSNGWLLQVGGGTPQILRCTKLAVASGLTSLPNMPDFPRSND
jgi:dimethylaniline monooxygenase (N-oxide forming)